MRTHLFAIMFFVLLTVYANADEAQIFESLVANKPSAKIDNKESGWKHLTNYYLVGTKMTLDSTDDMKYIANNGTERVDILDSLTPYVDSLNKWLSLSYDKEKIGISFSVAF
ncbi:MAG TPA: hypothetical protein ACFYD6_13175 [Candidatus Brocadiia bacterium]|nr:hypothetical protein [Candidatus Brocadiales bacterium]